MFAIKWSRWSAAEEDIIQCLIILSSLVFVGCRRWRETLANIRCHTLRQWMDNGYPSIFHASLSRGLKPTTMSISKQFDPFSWLIHQPDLICNPDWFPEESRVGFKGEEWCKILNLREPTTSCPKYCSEHSRWAMVFISVPWWLIYLVDGLFISQPEQTCIWVAGGKFRGVLFSGAVAQPCTSPSASWPRRVIRT